MNNADAQTVVIRAGAAKADPFTILVVANPALEAPRGTGQFIGDPIIADQPAFDACVQYIDRSLFGTLPNQVETLLGDPSIAPNVRLLSLFRTGQPADSAHSFVSQDSVSELLIARRDEIRSFLADERIVADIVYAISASATHTRASAWFTSDDDSRGGVPFTLDGRPFTHRSHYSTPGTIAMHHTADSLTAVHEFQHAISSYSNGKIVDLYVNSDAALNNKKGRPIPSLFGTYNPSSYNTDTRLAYDPTWDSFHCERHDPANPSIMDNYYHAIGPSEACQNDQITRSFVRDRVLAKMTR